MFEQLRIKILGYQPTAKISENLLERIILREFPENVNEVRARLKQIKSESIKGRNRIASAILKLSNKNITEIDRYIEKANFDYRDIISMAEYPRMMNKGFDDFSNLELKNIYLKDWLEYSNWLKGTNAQHCVEEKLAIGI